MNNVKASSPQTVPHAVVSREEWLTARIELLKAEKELTRHGDEVARQRQELPWVRIDKEYRFETDEENVSLADLIMLWAISRAPLAKLQAYKKRMGWSFPWASSFGSDFNFDFSASFTEQQQREGGYYNFRRDDPVMEVGKGAMTNPVSAENAGMTGIDISTYLREREGMSAFALEDGVVYHTYSTYSRGVDAIWSMYPWLDRAPKGRNESGPWVRRHDEY